MASKLHEVMMPSLSNVRYGVVSGTAGLGDKLVYCHHSQLSIDGVKLS
ncbi:hypothetical protein FHT60_003709 [Novosphingobium sp. BK486]|nr:hypothetical protein [Novosphingobium sp. BK256]MBB3376225.1 hypothetical protein [Novosphingobium sp. BK280]MBB3380639.1 hypothetical protein [Novosphingobium sp. BK258]MBB3422365.1 hypothetical protein [Novosphingobium sp. BK267]MBB3451065.1 hypothetical protein [Novosphingobium sp. BK352]MBB3479573.1 hypothetical protein [Novosphingobium sp. BK369]MBB3502812.1 hypothetical protein [Novosphingobium sp. BK336]MBB3538598.1 hypothetical protein [Novosphingobium sp. BK486]MBB3558068.1 hypo